MKTFVNNHKIAKIQLKNTFRKYENLNFDSINKTSIDFASHIEMNFEAIVDILLDYETYKVVKDETSRTLDLFKNLHQNKKYFSLRVGDVTSFLPKNQPLYAFSCFVLIPSLMATGVYFRIPASMRHFFQKLYDLLEIKKYFPNVHISHSERAQFLEERSAVFVDQGQHKIQPVTDVVIFTGTSSHAEKLRTVFDFETLFILNGSGHNPLVITELAELHKAVEAAIELQLYNQGQDCAAPNSILVHKRVISKFLALLKIELKKVRVGPYRDISCKVGPITNSNELIRIQNLLVENIRWLDKSTPGVIRTADSIVEPTIIVKPLTQGANFKEIFAPIFFIQEYESDRDLHLYFEHPNYSRNAMYVTVYGQSSYLDSIINKKVNNKIIHKKSSYLKNVHLHQVGVERGINPYGGEGFAASSISIHGKVIAKATLPQRDIFDFKVNSPLIKSDSYDGSALLLKASKIAYKDVRKIIQEKKVAENIEMKKSALSKHQYVDVSDYSSSLNRYHQLKKEKIITLLLEKNLSYMDSLSTSEKKCIRMLVKFLKNTKKVNEKKLGEKLYFISNLNKVRSKNDNKKNSDFFRNIYQLLLGLDYGPKLDIFLVQVDRKKVIELLQI